MAGYSGDGSSSRNLRTQFRNYILPFKSADPAQMEIAMDVNMSQSSSSSPPNHPVYVSPIRAGRTIREVSNEINDLRKENFNLKLRIFFLEEKITELCGREPVQNVKVNVDLQIELKNVRRELASTQEDLSIKDRMLDEALRSTQESQSNLRKAALQISDLEQQLRNLNQELRSREEQFVSPLESENENAMGRVAFGISESVSRTVSLHPSIPETKVEEEEGPVKGVNLLKNELLAKQKELELSAGRIKELEKSVSELQVKSKKKSYSIQALIQKLAKQPDVKSKEMWSLMEEGIDSANLNDQTAVVSTVNKIKVYFAELMSVPLEQMFPASQLASLERTFEVQEKSLQTHSKELCRSLSDPSADVQTRENELNKLQHLLDEKSSALEALQNSYDNLKKEQTVRSRLAPVDAEIETTDLYPTSYHSLEQKAKRSKSDEGETDNMDKRSISKKSVDVQTHEDSTLTKLKRLLEEKANALEALQNSYKNLKEEHIVRSRLAPVDAGTETTDLQTASYHSLEQKELRQSLSCRSVDVQTHGDSWTKLQDLLDEKSNALKALQNIYDDLKKEYFSKMTADFMHSRHALVDAGTETIDLHPASDNSLERKTKSSGYADKYSKSKEIMQSLSEASLSSLSSNAEFGKSNDLNYLKEKHLIQALKLEEKEKEISLLQEENKDLREQLQIAKDQKDIFSQQAFILQQHLEELATFLEQVIQGKSFSSSSFESSVDMLSQVSTYLDATLRLSQSMSQNLSLWDLSKNFSFDETLLPERRPSLPFDNKSLSSSNLKLPIEDHDAEGRDVHSETYIQNLNKPISRKRWFLSSQLQQQPSIRLGGQDHLSIFGLDGGEDMSESTGSLLSGIGGNYDHSGVQHLVELGDVVLSRPKPRPCWSLPDRKETFSNLRVLDHATGDNLAEIIPFHQNGRPHEIVHSSESDIWSEPDRDVAIQRIGIDTQAPLLSSAQKRRGREKFPKDATSSSATSEPHFRRKRSGSQSQVTVQLVDKRLSVVESQQSKIVALQQTLEQQVSKLLSGLNEESFLAKMENSETVLKEIGSFRSTLVNAMNELRELKEAVKDSVSQNQEVGIIQELRENMEKVLRAVQYDENLKDVPPNQSKDIAKQALSELNIFKEQLLTVASTLLSQESLEHVNHSNNEANVTHLELLLDQERLQNSKLMQDLSNLSNENQALQRQLDELQNALDMERRKPTSSAVGREAEKYTAQSVVEDTGHKPQLGNLLLKKRPVSLDSLREELKQTKDKLKAMESKCRAYQQDLNRVTQEKMDTSSENQVLKETVEAQKLQIEETRSHSEELQSSHDQLKISLGDAEDKIAILETKCRVLKQEIETLSNQHIKTLKQCTSLGEVIQTQMDKIADMNKKHAEYSSEKISLQNTINQLRMETRTLKRKIQGNASQIDEESPLENSFDLELCELQSQISNLQNEVHAKETVVQEQADIIQEFKKENDDLKHRCARFKGFNESLEHENSQFAEELPFNKYVRPRSSGNVQIEPHDLQMEIINLKEMCNSKDAVNEELKKTIANLQNDIQALTRSVFASKDLYRSTEKENIVDEDNVKLSRGNSLEKQLRESKTQSLSLLKELECRDTEIQNQASVILSLKGELECKDKEIQEQTAMAMHLKEEIGHAGGETEGQTTMIMSLKERLNRKDKEIQDQSNMIVSLKEELKRKDKEIQEPTSVMYSSKDKADDFEDASAVTKKPSKTLRKVGSNLLQQQSTSAEDLSMQSQEELRNIIIEKQTILTEMENECMNLKRMNQELDGKFIKLQDENSMLQKRLELSESTVDDMKRAILPRKESSRPSLKTTTQELKETLYASVSHIPKLSRADNDSDIHVKPQHQNVLDKSQSDHSVQSPQEKIVELREELNRAYTLQADAQALVDLQQHELAGKSLVISQTEEKQRKLEENLENVQHENMLLKDQVYKLQKSLESTINLKNPENQREQMKDGLPQTLIDLHQVLSSKEAEIQEMKEKAEKMEMRMQQILRENDMLHEKNRQQMTTPRKKGSESAAELKEELIQKLSSISHLQHTLKDPGKEILDQLSYANIEGRLTQCCNDLLNKEAENDLLNDSLSRLRSEMNFLADSLNSEKQSNARLLNELSNQQCKLSINQAKLKEAEVERGGLEDRLQTALSALSEDKSTKQANVQKNPKSLIEDDREPVDTRKKLPTQIESYKDLESLLKYQTLSNTLEIENQSLKEQVSKLEYQLEDFRKKNMAFAGSSTHEKIKLEKPTQEKLENLNIDNLLLKERITDLEKQIRDHLSLLNTEKRKNSILSAQLIDLKDHRDQEQVSDVTEKVRDLANFMLQDETQQNKIIDLEKKLEVLQLHILEDDSIIHEQREERERLLTTLDMKTQWTKDLEDKLRETENDLATTYKSVAEKTNFINDLRAKFSIQAATMKALEASKHDLENGIQQKIMENHENLTRFTLEKEALETKVSEVEAEMKQLRVEIVNKDRKAVLAEKAYKELEENFLKVENDYKVLCKNLLEKAETINTLNADLSAKSNMIEQLEACKRELEREMEMQQKFKDVKQSTTSAVQSVNTDEETIEKRDFATMNVPSQSGKLCQTSLSDLTKHKDAVRNLPKIVTEQFPTVEKSVSTDDEISEKHDFATMNVPSQSDKSCQISLSDLSRYKDEIPNLQKIVTQQVPTAEKSVSTDEETSEKRGFAIMCVPPQSDKLCQTSLSDLSKYKDAIPNLQRMVKWKDKQVSTDEQSVSSDEETREKRDFATMNVPSQAEKVCQTSLFDLSKYEDAIQNLQKMLKSKEAQYDQLAAAHSSSSQLVNLESQPQTTRATSKVSKMTSVNLIDTSVPKFSAAQQASDIVSNKILYPARKTLSSVVTVQEYEELQSNPRFQELVLELSQYIKISFDTLSRCIAQLAKFHAVPFLSTETRCPVGGQKQQDEESRSESIEKSKSENLSLQQELKESKRNRLILENQVQQLLFNIKDLEEKNSKLYNIAFAVGKQRDALPSTEVDEEETTNIKHLLDSKWNLQQSILRLQRELCKMHSSNLEKQMSFIEHVRNTYDKVQYYSTSKPQSDSAIYGGPMCAGSHITKEHYLSLKMDVECLYNTRSLLKYFVVPLVKSVKTYDSTIASKINSLSESVNKKLDVESWGSIEFVRNVKECKLPADDFRQSTNERRFQKEMVDLSQELSTVKSENEFLRCELDRYKKMMPSIELQSEFETLKKSNSEIKQILIDKGLFLRGADNSAVHAKGALNSSKWGSLTSLSSANSAKHSGESDHQKERFSVSHRNSKNYAESNAKNQIIDDLGDSQVQRSHYSSPDLGIESDPNQEHVMLESGNLSDLLKTKQMAAPPPYHKDSMVNHVPYAFIILEDFELLRKEVEECIVDMKKIGSRANNGLEIISKEDTPKKSFTCSTLRRILDCCGNAEVCLLRSQKLMNKFKYSLFPADQKGMLAFDYYLNRAQQLDGVVVKLIAEKQKQDELLVSAMRRLQEFETKKYLTERAMVKKLTKTKKVLRRLKHRDELKGAGSA